MKFNHVQFSGASWILTNALQVPPEQTVLLIYDEASEEVAECITGAASNLGIATDCQLVPNEVQARFQPSTLSVISESLRAKIDERLHVIVLQELRPEINHFRMLVLEYCKGNKLRKTASLPGFTIDSLQFCAGNLDTIQHLCSLVADLFVRASEAKIETTSLDGTKRELFIPLGDYMPIMSTGRIAAGSWGNVPSGETFIVPRERMARGEISLQGSVLGYAIPKNEELLLEFQRGKAKVKNKPIGALEAAVNRILFDSSGREVEQNCSLLAELGIGTNGSISKLTGEPLFDEKVLGTVHLGLGRNTQFGGTIKSSLHNDYVATAASLTVDSVSIIKSGAFVLTEASVYPSWKTLEHPNDDFATIARGASSYVQIGGMAYVQWADPRSPDLQTTLVGNPETARLSSEVLSILTRISGPISVSLLMTALPRSFPLPALQPLLQFLSSFELISRA